MPDTSFLVSVDISSDWGVGTGIGAMGASHALVERDMDGNPVIRATVLAGLFREQAAIVAEALDSGELPGEKPQRGWRAFAARLFGNAENPRLVRFSDTTTEGGSQPTSSHDTVSVSINPSTGTAKEDHLRFFERAAATKLQGTATLVDVDVHGNTIEWTSDQLEAAELILSMAALLVRSVGSNRSDGDGQCSITLRDAAWCEDKLAVWKGKVAPEPPSASSNVAENNTPKLKHETGGALRSAGLRWFHADLDIELKTPLVSYDVPISNEIPSLDFLRGTVLLPWIHRQVRLTLPDASTEDEVALVRDAVVNGDLVVSDATAVVDGVRGLPTPFVLSIPKVESGTGPDDLPEGFHVVSNRLHCGQVETPQKLMRGGYVYPRDIAQSADLLPEEASEPLAKFSFGAPSLTGRQSAAHDATTGTTKNGQLFLVKALPAGLRMRATVSLSQRLHDLVGAALVEQLSATAGGAEALLGSRRLSGNYGRTQCALSSFGEEKAAPIKWDDGATTLWFTSDVVVRSAALGSGGSVGDLLRAFQDAGVTLEVPQSNDHFTVAIRHRRVDSWSAADHQPRPTRLAIAAGSVIRVRPSKESDRDQVANRLAKIAELGIGELRAQGFGRFVVGHPLLSKEAALGSGQFVARELHRSDFLPNQATVNAQETEGEDA